MSEPRVIIIGNPYSGSGDNRRGIDALAAALSRRGFAVTVALTDEQKARAERIPAHCVVAAGGDGTAHHVINGAYAGPLAVLPLGTENLYADTFGFTADVESLAAFIERGRVKRIDLATAGDRRFGLMISAGFDADVAHRLDRWRTRKGPAKRVRRRTYRRFILTSAGLYRWPRITLETDDDRIEGAHVMVFNLPEYGFDLDFAPDARGDDGVLDWVVFENPGVWRMHRYWRAVRRGEHFEFDDVKRGRTKRCAIRAAPAAPVQLDGEAFGRTPVEIDIHPAALPVIDAG